MQELKPWLIDRRKLVDKALKTFLPRKNTKPQTIHEAMHYSVFAGGKRLRPILCTAAAEACGVSFSDVQYIACALEVLHTYSLVHDDLPCMDDDDLRRGHPTNHKVFGEGIAVLAGDALLTEAFVLISQAEESRRYKRGDYVRELAYAASSKQLIGGQVLDLEGESKALNKQQLVAIHKAKTAALVTASISLGAMAANASPKTIESLREFGMYLGLAFQVVDDILDVTQSTQVLGKTAGKDEQVEKTTYPSVIGLEASKREARKLTKKALDALQPLGKKAFRLEQIAHYMLDREF